MLTLEQIKSHEHAEHIGSMVDDISSWKARAIKAEANLEAYQLITLYANDIIAMWPKFTLRTIGTMTGYIESLKQAVSKITN